MTGKCCRECVKHSEHVGDRDYCQLWQSYIPGHPDTFYCSAFTRRNSAKPTGQTEENVENTVENIPPIQRKFV